MILIFFVFSQLPSFYAFLRWKHHQTSQLSWFNQFSTHPITKLQSHPQSFIISQTPVFTWFPHEIHSIHPAYPTEQG